jgi:hypothetical protein
VVASPVSRADVTTEAEVSYATDMSTFIDPVLRGIWTSRLVFKSNQPRKRHINQP